MIESSIKGWVTVSSRIQYLKTLIKCLPSYYSVLDLNAGIHVHPLLTISTFRVKNKIFKIFHQFRTVIPHFIIPHVSFSQSDCSICGQYNIILPVLDIKYHSDALFVLKYKQTT